MLVETCWYGLFVLARASKNLERLRYSFKPIHVVTSGVDKAVKL